MMTIDQLVQLSHELKRMGCGVKLTLTAQLPIDPPEPPPLAVMQAAATAAAGLAELPLPTDAPPQATMRTVLHVLNRLHGAPGQPNRELVRKYLFRRGWIGGADEPEAWNLDHVPISKDGITRVFSEISQFAEDERKAVS